MKRFSVRLLAAGVLSALAAWSPAIATTAVTVLPVAGCGHCVDGEYPTVLTPAQACLHVRGAGDVCGPQFLEVANDCAEPIDLVATGTLLSADVAVAANATLSIEVEVDEHDQPVTSAYQLRRAGTVIVATVDWSDVYGSGL